MIGWNNNYHGFQTDKRAFSLMLVLIILGATLSLTISSVSSAFSQTGPSLDANAGSATTRNESLSNESLELAIVPNQYIVKFKDPGEMALAGVAIDDPASGLIQDLETQGIEVNISRTLSGLNTAVVNISPPAAAAGFTGVEGEEPTPDEVVKLLEQNPLVDSAQVDMKMTGIKPIIGSNASASSSALLPQMIPSGINRIDAASFSGSDTINADIGILDTGVQSAHADLNHFRSVSFTGTSNDDLCGHGTHVAGTAAAKDNSYGVIGTAPDARIWNIKVLESEDPSNPQANCSAPSLSSILTALNYVAENADSIDVINLSLTGYCPIFVPECDATPYEEAINDVIDRGVVVVVAAGNNAAPADWFVPARFPNVITVSAISDSDGKCGGLGNSLVFEDKDDTFASYSNYGPLVDVAAPGSDILSTWHDGSYEKATGTSMASPHVAGLAALYKSEQPDASPSEVLNAILTSTTTQDDQCDGKGRGYFTGDPDGISEPLAYGGNNFSSSLSGNASATIR
jgi:subtilisin